jgi:hypothetical protein
MSLIERLDFSKKPLYQQHDKNLLGGHGCLCVHAHKVTLGIVAILVVAALSAAE